jgi:hypothetical protein
MREVFSLFAPEYAGARSWAEALRIICLECFEEVAVRRSDCSIWPDLAQNVKCVTFTSLRKSILKLEAPEDEFGN